jgi:hypothetical protein
MLFFVGERGVGGGAGLNKNVETTIHLVKLEQISIQYSMKYKNAKGLLYINFSGVLHFLNRLMTLNCLY